MDIGEAVTAICSGHRVRNCKGTVFWLERDAKGRPVLMGEPANYGKPIKHLVLSSEHFDLKWEIVS